MTICFFSDLQAILFIGVIASAPIQEEIDDDFGELGLVASDKGLASEWIKLYCRQPIGNNNVQLNSTLFQFRESRIPHSMDQGIIITTEFAIRIYH